MMLLLLLPAAAGAAKVKVGVRRRAVPRRASRRGCEDSVTRVEEYKHAGCYGASSLLMSRMPQSYMSSSRKREPEPEVS